MEFQGSMAERSVPDRVSLAGSSLTRMSKGAYRTIVSIAW